MGRAGWKPCGRKSVWPRATEGLGSVLHRPREETAPYTDVYTCMHGTGERKYLASLELRNIYRRPFSPSQISLPEQKLDRWLRSFDERNCVVQTKSFVSLPFTLCFRFSVYCVRVFAREKCEYGNIVYTGDGSRSFVRCFVALEEMFTYGWIFITEKFYALTMCVLYKKFWNFIAADKTHVWKCMWQVQVAYWKHIFNTKLV